MEDSFLRVYKYELEMERTQTLNLPVGFRPLSLQNQRGEICLWALIDLRQPTRPVEFLMFGTGHGIPESYNILEQRHAGTVQVGPFVWHFFYTGGGN